MTKPFFLLLRSYLTKEGIEQRYLAKLMDRSVVYVNQRFTGKKAWSQDDQYFLMDLLHIPYNQMHELFPKEGKKIS